MTHDCETLSVGARKPLVIVHGEKEPIEAVASDLQGDPAGYLYFSVFMVDHREQDDDQAQLVCASCVLEAHPELGRAFDLAKRGRGGWRYIEASDDWIETLATWN